MTDRPPCKYFAQGHCRLGTGCLFAHSTPAATKSPTPTAAKTSGTASKAPAVDVTEKDYLHARQTYETAALVASYPPNMKHPNKLKLYSLSCPNGTVHRGQLAVSRWRLMTLPERFSESKIKFVMKESSYGYEPQESGFVEWYVNFADRQLFGFYGSPLFAQDEVQANEHPALCSLREALLKSGVPGLEPLTTERKTNIPSPILIMGAERRIRVATDPDAKAGRPDGLYGNAFSWAEEDAIEKAVTKINPPTITNLMAMEAPKYGRGAYSMQEIKFTIGTAYTAFRAAKHESITTGRTIQKDGKTSIPRVRIHTGNWGTGAYGGNKVMMALLQLAAARLALGDGDELVFHTFKSEFSAAYHEAESVLQTLLVPDNSSSKTAGAVSCNAFLTLVEGLHLQWGSTDGT